MQFWQDLSDSMSQIKYLLELTVVTEWFIIIAICLVAIYFVIKLILSWY